MKILRLILIAALPLLAALPLSAADRASVQGVLISGSNEPGQTDRRLASYEPTLRRILRFESYRYHGEDSATLGVPAQGALSVGDGHTLELTTERADSSGIAVKVRWMRGGRAMMSTGLVLRPGVPAVLGGPGTGRGGDVYAVILVGR